MGPGNGSQNKQSNAKSRTKRTMGPKKATTMLRQTVRFAATLVVTMMAAPLTSAQTSQFDNPDCPLRLSEIHWPRRTHASRCGPIRS